MNNILNQNIKNNDKFSVRIKGLERPVLTLGIIALSLFLAFKFGLLSSGPGPSSISSPAAEITAIKITSNLNEQIKLYTELIERVGPKRAQMELYKSGLPFTGQTHLLNHAVGDYLYRKYGPAGLLQCEDYFLSSCYHGFVLHAIGEGGMLEVGKTFAECRKEGPTVSSQCAHAIGHGFLANIGYKNLIKALETCDEAVSTMSGFPAFNCYDGVFMENIWAVHEGKPSPDRWIKESDKEYPCNDKRIDGKYILACWSNQPSLAFQFFKGDVKKVADLCAQVKRREHQRMCFDGLARQIHPLTGGQASLTFDLCNLMPSPKWVNFCLVTNAASGYAVGDREIPFQVCAGIGEEAKGDCYSRIFSNMRAYAKPGEDTKKLCAKVQSLDFRQKCEKLQQPL